VVLSAIFAAGTVFAADPPSAEKESALTQQKIDEAKAAEFVKELKSILENEQKRLESRRFEAGVASAERALLFHNGITDGRRLGQRGDYAGALRLWRSLIPYMNHPSEIEKQIILAEAALARRDELDATIEKDKNAKFEAPFELPGMIEEAVRRLDEQVVAGAAQRETVLASLREQQKRIDEAYKNANSHFAAENPAAAARELERVLPELADPKPTLRLVELLRALHDQRQNARADIDRIHSDAAKTQSPAELVQLLRATDLKIQAGIAEFEKEKKEARAQRKEHIRYVNWSFQNGKKLFDQGNYAAAITAWNDIVPYLENGPLIEGLIVNLKEAYARYVAERAEAEKAKALATKAPGKPEFETTLLESARRFDDPKTLPVQNAALPTGKDLPPVVGSDANKALDENDRIMRDLMARKKDAR